MGLKKNNSSQFKLRNEVDNILTKLNDTDKNDCVLEKFDIKAKKNGTSTLLTMNGIQFALFFKFYRVMMVLLTKVIHLREYLGEYELLEQAMESEDDEQLGEIMKLYQQEEVDIFVPVLSQSAKESLYTGNWNQGTIEAIYPLPLLPQFVVPKNQQKAKMYATLCYNRFFNEPGIHKKRHGAREEADHIIKGLKSCGFTIRGPLIDWKWSELLKHLKNFVNEAKDDCSVIFIFIMSHGAQGVLIDIDGNRGY